jgi:hypothetical protein
MPKIKFNLRQAAVIIGGFILVLLVLDFNARLEDLDRLNHEATIVRAQATAVMQTQVALATKVASADSAEAVDEWARQNHYIQPGDQAVVPMGVPGSVPLEQPSPTPQPTPMANWQVWMELLFGETER